MSSQLAATSSSPLSFCVLGSGSAGNSTVVIARVPGQSQRSVFLIDAGLSPRRTMRSLAALGIGFDDVAAIVLTHLDSDHFNASWLKLIARRTTTETPLRVHVHHRHRNAAWRSGLTARETDLFRDDLTLPGGVDAEPVLLAHDDLGSVGFVLSHAGHRMGYATDLGAVPAALLDRFVNLHALCIESNYDRAMQEASARPTFLKRRIMDGRGHLSNEQAMEAAKEIDKRSCLEHIALLHLSRECNCPKRVDRLWRQGMPHAMERLTITSQREATPLLAVRGHALQVEVKPRPMRQTMLFNVADAHAG